MAMTTFPIKIEPIAHENVIEDPLEMENGPDGPIKKEQSFDKLDPLEFGTSLLKLSSDHPPGHL